MQTIIKSSAGLKGDLYAIATFNHILLELRGNSLKKLFNAAGKFFVSYVHRSIAG
jgi:hypothetical protein